VDLSLDPEPFHELAIACYTIAFVTYPTHPNFAIEAGALGITLDAIAARLERAAAKPARQRVARPRVVPLATRTPTVSTATATVQLSASVDATGGVALVVGPAGVGIAAINAIHADFGRKIASSFDFGAISAINADFGRRIAETVLFPTLAALTSAPFLKSSVSTAVAAFGAMGADAFKVNMAPTFAALASVNIDAFRKAYASTAIDAIRHLPRITYTPSLEMVP
jgi:hypothetical protein